MNKQVVHSSRRYRISEPFERHAVIAQPEVDFLTVEALVRCDSTAVPNRVENGPLSRCSPLSTPCRARRRPSRLA